MTEIDAKELKILSDILALVLEEEEGQSVAALSALRTRARKKGLTGGALKNMFAKIAVEPGKVRRTRSTTRVSAEASDHENTALRQRVQMLTMSLQNLDVRLRSSEADASALRHEIAQTRHSHNRISALLEVETRSRSRSMTMVYISLAAGIVLGVAMAQLFHEISFSPSIDRASYLQ